MAHVMRFSAWIALAALAPPLATVTLAADMSREKLLRYGEQLAQECVTCHRRDGKDVGIPGIVAMTEQEFVDAMMLYKTGRRKNKVMVSVTGSLEAAQIQALAIYITSQSKP
jgi:cytochrome c553